MLKVSTKARYGLRVLVSISSIQRKEHYAVLSRIAVEQGISEKYLEHIVALLRKNGLVVGKRGSRGGYRIARPENEISLREAFEALEGPVEPVFCVSNPDTCERTSSCVTREVWKKLQKAILNELSTITLKDLVDKCEPLPRKSEKKKDEKFIDIL